MIKSVLLAGLGGAAGSILRYLCSLFINKYHNGSFPLATFFINITGCFIIGIIVGFLQKQQIENDNLKLLFATGFCGGYTTFSAFASENLLLIQQNNHFTALAYIGASLIAGLFAVWLGMVISN